MLCPSNKPWQHNFLLLNAVNNGEDTVVSVNRAMDFIGHLAVCGLPNKYTQVQD